jgi:membrane-associated phospholipid phosphatase
MEETMLNKIIHIFLRLCFMISIPAVTLIHYFLNKFRPNIHNINTGIDAIIPFNRFFAVPYIYWFAYLPTILIYFAVSNSKVYYKLLCSIVMGMCCCFVVFYFFPTTVHRPTVLDRDVFSNLVKYIYKSDNPYDCFPSLHVLDAFLPSIFLFKYNKKLLVRIISVVSFLSITASTVFIKQHYILDVVSAIILGMAMYLLFGSDFLWGKNPAGRITDYSFPSESK